MFGVAKGNNLSVSRLKDTDTSHTSLTFMQTILSEVEEVRPLSISTLKELSWKHLVDKMAKNARKRFGFLKKVHLS